ncbi:hypothetical protein JCM3765_003394 [Sporobolomyces pararoseus]
MAQPRIVLRPPPHRDYLQGYPGIPASDPAKDPAPSQNPLFQLPHLLRPQAHLSGTVEIRSPAKGPQIRAKWLSLELEKIETIPPQSSSTNGSSKSNDKDKSNSQGKFVELIGTGPSRLWLAGEHQGAPAANANKKKGSPFKKKGNNNGDDDDGFDFIPDANYPFKIPLPEGLPPSTDVDMKSSGISYQLVASLCVKGKKSILKTATKPTILLASASIILHKADILASFPAYSPVLTPPVPAKLPWIVPGGLTVGEAKESSLTIRRGFGGAEGSEGGQVTLKVIRKCSAFGPGDPVPIFVELKWSGDTPIRLTRLDFVLREQITYRYPSPNNSAYLVRSPPRNNSIFTVNANVSAASDTPTAFAVLYRDEPISFELAGNVPTTHTRVTVRTAKHIDVAYHLRIRAMIEGGEEVIIDQWPVVIGNVNARVARGIVADIGYVEGLCERGGLTEATKYVNGNEAVQAPRFEEVITHQPQTQTQRNVSTLAPPTIVPSPQVESPAAYSDSSTEKRRLLEARSNLANGSSFHVSNPTHEQLQSQHSTPRLSTPERPTPIRPQFAPSPTAEEEKRRYYEAATKSRDHLQGLRSEQTTPNHSRDTSFPISLDALRYRHASDGPSAMSPTSSTALTDTPVSPFVYQEASVVKLREDDDYPGSRPANGHAISRSDTILAASGSAVSTTLEERTHPATQPSLLSPPSARSIGTSMLNRSLTSAESEKKRLFLEAKEMARVRQEEARLELERQNKVLEDFEFEEAQRDFEERLILEAEEERRKEEERERIAFERRLELERLEKLAQFEREQREAQEKRQAEADKWARERKEEDEMKKRKAEELRRMDEQKEREESERRGALARKAAMERQRAEDEERRLAGERARREEAERRYRAEQVAVEEELRRRREEERRLQEEHDRRLQEEEHRRRVEQDRREEEDNRRIYLERVRAEEDAALAQRARSSAQQAYPSTYGRSSAPTVHPSIPPRRVTPALDRAPSVASFAPSMSAANADSNFYAQAIASGQASALSQEKAEYLRQLRQGQNYPNGTPSSSPPTSQQQHHQEYRQEEYRSPPPPQPRQVSDTYSRDQQAPRSRSTTPTPTAHRPDPPSSSSVLNGYKTAAEEKAEMAARRRAEEEQARNFPNSGSIVNGGGLDEEGDLLAPPPSYPVPGSSVSHGPTPTRSAAEEKEELSAYYRAKQAVETGRAQQQQPEPPSPPSIRQAYPTSLSTSNGYHHPSSSPSAPPPPPQHSNTYPSPVSSSSDGTPSQAHIRDPEVSLGKQRAESTSSTSYPESILRNYSSQSPSAPPLPLPVSTPITGYPDDRGRGGESGYERPNNERGVGVEGFERVHLETQFS